MAEPTSLDSLQRENDELRRRLDDAESIVHAIRRHEVDAFVVQKEGEDEGVLVLDGVDRPYRLLIERMQQGAAVLSPDGAIVYANGRLSELLEAPITALRGAAFSHYVAPETAERFSRLLEQGASGEASEQEVALARSDGSVCPALLTLSPLLEHAGVLCLIVTDLTQQKQHEEERERLTQEKAARAAAEQRAGILRSADRRKDEFLAMLGHELRNPLAPLRNGLQILTLADTGDLAAHRTREMMARQLEGLIRLVDDLLDVGRVTQGKIDLHRERTDLKLVVTRALESARTTIDERDHSVEVSLPDLPLPIDGDVVRLAQVVTNLLNNAAKFTPRGGKLQLRVTADPAARQAAICVRDNGEGIAPEMLPRVFDLFMQVDRSAGRAAGGLGIGLTLARRLVEMHDGSIQVASEGLDKGSEFTIRLPLAADEAVVGHVRENPAPRPQSPPKRILVVDDNQDSAESLTMLLRLIGHDVREAYDGQSALSVLGDFVPDVLLLDIGLPGMSGYEVAKQVRSHPGLRGMRLIALSGYGSEEDRRSAREAGFDAHLVKPVDFSSLESLLAGI